MTDPDPDLSQLRELLGEEPAPLRPMWPWVQRRLRGERPAARPRWSWSWAMGSGALATAGFAIGLIFGAGGPAGTATEESFWGDLGSSFAEGSPYPLYSLYESLEGGGEDGELAR